MIEYKKTLYPLHECLGLIERFVNDADDLTKMYEYCENDQEKDRMKRLFQVLDVMKKEFDRLFFQDRYLFEYLHKEEQISCVRALLYPCFDDQERSEEQSFEHIKQCYQKDSFLFIKEIVSFDKVLDHIKDKELLEAINGLMLDDGIKWRLYQLHYHLDEFINKVEEIFKAMLPIYHQFDDLYQEFLYAYQEELAFDLNGMGSYDFVVKKLNLKFSDENIIIVPTISNMRSLSFVSVKKDHNQTCLIVYWGIGTLERVMKDEESIDLEALCSSLKLLSDRSKFDILRFVAKRKAYGAQIANELKLSTPTISYHMQSLLNAKLVTIQKDNNRLYYQMNQEYLKKVLTQVYHQLTGE